VVVVEAKSSTAGSPATGVPMTSKLGSVTVESPGRAAGVWAQATGDKSAAANMIAKQFEEGRLVMNAFAGRSSGRRPEQE
jgi:hypothetical protein